MVGHGIETRARPALVRRLGRLEGMLASDIYGLILKRIDGIQHAFEVLLDFLQKT